PGLIDCSLLMPPRQGPDKRLRYTMLRTLRAFAMAHMADAGEEDETIAALAAFALAVAEEAGPGLEAGAGELDAVCWLDAEDATLSRGLAWLLDHDQAGALRLAAALAPWWRLRGRMAEAYGYLSTALSHTTGRLTAGPAPVLARAQVWLGHVSANSGDPVGSLDCYVAAASACGNPSRELVDALMGQTAIRLNLGDVAGAARDAGDALKQSRELGYAAGEVQALTGLSLTAFYTGDAMEAVARARQARASLQGRISGYVARWCHMALAHVLLETGDIDTARHMCAAGIALSRQVGDLADLTNLLNIKVNIERLAGDADAAGAALLEAVAISTRTGDRIGLLNCVDEGAYLCVMTERWAEAATLWAALETDRRRLGLPSESVFHGRRNEYEERIEQALAPAEVREARARGARLALATAVELVTMLAATAGESAGTGRGTLLSSRERELVTLVGQGHTNAEIAARLSISVRTVSSHLDRIRAKTGYRRRADLTRLALNEGLI
ncbi:MAG: response regulator transcription factor, partial [Trebonia sp.]